MVDRLFVFILLLGLSISAKAQYLAQCQSAAQSSDSQCKGAVAGVASTDAARSAATGAASGANINTNSGSLQRDIASQRSAINNARTTCAAAKKSCTQSCDQAQKSAQAASAKNPQAAREAQQIPGVKRSKCEQPIDAELTRLTQADGNLAQDGQDTNKTKDASQNGAGAPMQTPQQQQKDKGDQTSEATPTTAQSGSSLNCSANGSERFSDCNGDYVARCATSQGDSRCIAFADRYCALNSTSAVSDSGAVQAKTNLVIDKRGEGLGSAFCQDAVAYRFCQSSGRAGCPSCVRLNAASTCTGVNCLSENSAEMLNRARESCPTDPVFLTASKPAGTDAQVSTGYSPQSASEAADASRSASTAVSTLGYGASTGGGSFGGSGATGSGVASGLNGTREGVSRGVATKAGSLGGFGSGGGGTNDGDGGSDSSGESAGAFNPASFDAKKPMPAEAIEGHPGKDVSNSFGPSIFSIGATAYKNYCSKRAIKGCGR
ncbi:MAG: hypothetical protein KF799_16180 [Bdellovibrionales bacterium]|nr:hypothetical protein [Bdellovibrionales bacterium]